MTTIPDPLPRILVPFLGDLRGTLGSDLVGAYLYGSAIAGGFEAATSDLDVLVVTATPIDRTPLATFQGLIDRLVTREPDWADRLDITFIDRATLATFRSGGALLSISHDEPLRRHDEADDWLETWFLVREASHPLVGPPATQLIPAIAAREFIVAVLDGVEGLIARLSVKPKPGSRAYLVLTLGRMLRSMETGALCSKTDGATWIVGHDPGARPLVDECLAIWRSRGRLGFSPAGEGALPGLIASLGEEIRTYVAKAHAPGTRV